MKTKNVYIIAGPNGSGKTTFAKELIKELNLPFVNADEIALEMSPE
ncbi:MAG: AAA family ATPase, partial [Nitrospirota bacterium]